MEPAWLGTGVAAVVVAVAVGAALRLREPAAAQPLRALDHLEELRRRALVVVGTAIAATLLALGFRIGSWHGWTVPIPDLYDNLAAQLLRAVARHVVPAQVRLITTSPMEGFSAQFSVGLGIGIAVAFPVALYHLARFFGPALATRERHVLANALIPATVLFLAGAAFCYVAVLPVTMRALYQFGAVLGAESFLQAGDLAGTVLTFMAGFGFAFETPLVMVALARSGLVDGKAFLRHWRHAVLAVFLAAGILTPDPTVISQFMLALPLLGLYFAGAGLAVRASRMRS